MTPKNKRVLVYMSICYFVVSIFQFGVFIFSSRSYFYKAQKEAVVRRVKADEEFYLRSVLNIIRTDFKILETKRETHHEVLKNTAVEQINILERSLLLYADKKEEALEPSGEAEAEPFLQPKLEIEGMDKIRLKKLLNPYKSSDFEQKLISYFDEINESDFALIQVQRVGRGVPSKPVPMDKVLLCEKEVLLHKGGFDFKWKLKAYGGEIEAQETDYKALLEEIRLVGNASDFNKLAIYRHGGGAPIYLGEDNSVKSIFIQLQEKQSQIKSSVLFLADQVRSEFTRDDEQVEKIILNAVLSDPKMKVSLTFTQRMSQDRWMEFSYLERYQIPVGAYIFLAWIFCPIGAFVAYRMASKFQFSMTLDLDDIDGENELEEADEEEVLEKTPSLAEVEKIDKREDVPVLAKAKTPAPNAVTAPRSVDVQKQRTSSILDGKAVFDNIHSGELDEVRSNNIRKSQGMFEEPSQEKSDFLEGVQSDVLKNLIHKLRQG